MTYRVDLAEAAEAEIDAAYLWISRQSPERAGQWYSGLLQVLESLSEMPRRCPLARENPHFEEEVRQLLYGRGRSVYRILFVIRDTPGNHEEPSVRIIHVRHGAQQTLGTSD
jgi:plasmid stabilization system protein ParE